MSKRKPFIEQWAFYNEGRKFEWQSFPLLLILVVANVYVIWKTALTKLFRSQ